MLETEWFEGRQVVEEHEQPSVSPRLVIDIVIAGVVLALLGVIGGCASTPPADEQGDGYLRMVCAVIQTGTATFEGVGRKFPSMQLVCEEEK